MSEDMQHVIVRFLDDETLPGTARNLSFDEPDFLVDVGPGDGTENNETAWVPLTAVKVVEFPQESAQMGASPRKIAIRFLDGEVMRGYAGTALDRHRHGVIMAFAPEDPKGPARRLGIPFSAIKALFYLREFDGRPGDEKGMPSEAYLARRTMAPLLDVLDEMDMLTRLHKDGVLSDNEYESKRSQILERI
jgi:hypothetical protein